MGILKNIFGSPNKKKKQEVEEQIKDIESGKINMIYPILKPGSWEGLKYGALKKIIIGTEADPYLVIGYGYNGPKDFIFLTEKHLEKQSPSEMLKEAHQNLDEFQVNFNEVIPNKVVIVDGLDFCSEKILSKPFRIELQKKLNSNRLLISIPRRRNLMATSAHNDPEIMNKFLTIHTNTWNDNSYGNAQITDVLFVIEDGEIVDHIELNNGH